MKTLLITLMMCAVCFAGCAGREAAITSVYRPGDEKRSCTSLKTEMSQIEADVARKLKKDADKFWYNAAMFAGGCVIIAPFFLMDLKGAEKTEAEFLQQRHNHLAQLASEKDCD